jgi:hypothetical protein
MRSALGREDVRAGGREGVEERTREFLPFFRDAIFVRLKDISSNP